MLDTFSQLSTYLTESEKQVLSTCEGVIERGLKSFIEVGTALQAIRDNRLYRESFATFEAYCQDKWNLTSRHANRLIEAVEVNEDLRPMGLELPTNERQARPLSRVEPEIRAELWQTALDTAPNGKVTAAHVEKVVNERQALKQERKEEKAARKDYTQLETQEYKLIHSGIESLREHLQPESVDFIITDPPYPKEYLGLYETLAELGDYALKPGGSLLAMIGQSYLPEIIEALGQHLTYHWVLSYQTPGGQAVQLWQRKVNTFWKPVLWYIKGKYTGDWVGDVAKSNVNDNDKRFHDWGQSESGMADLIERFTDPGHLILDPFLGGGTTGLVAVKMKRGFIGSDKDETCIQTTLERLQNV